MGKNLRVGTRSSPLARAQTQLVISKLKALCRDLTIEIVPITTRGDRQLQPFAEIGGKGLFTEALEHQMRCGRIDCAVHSLKDLPVDLPEDFVLAAVTAREDPHDMLVCADPRIPCFEELSPGATVGTSSLRRKAQLLHKRPDLNIEALRGNLGTRLKKLKQGEADAIVIAAAGLYRLAGTSILPRDEPFAYQVLPFEIMLPAPGQGALAVETRAADTECARLFAGIHDEHTAYATRAERTLLKALGGGCQVPLGALGAVQGKQLCLEAVITLPDGSKSLRERSSGPPAACEEIGMKLAEQLMARGAEEIIRHSIPE